MLSKKLKDFLDDKLWSTAKVLIDSYTRKGYKIAQFNSVDTSNNYKLHIIAKKGYETIAIEIRERCSINSYFEKLVLNCQAKKIAVKIYFAVPDSIDGVDTTIAHGLISEIKNLGVGLLIVKGKSVAEGIKTISCHRRFAIEPGTSLGKYNSTILAIVENYNTGDCLDSVRSLSEEVEDATVMLALKAARKGKIVLIPNDIENNIYDWEYLINCLSTQNFGGRPQTKYFDTKMSNSMKTFKDVRNLSDHRKTQKEKKQLEERYPEAMLQGIRLLRTLVALKAKIK